MTLELIEDFSRLLDFHSEWAAFTRDSDTLTPFQTPEWLTTWWRHFGSGKLHVLVFRERGCLTGVIPCFLHQWSGLRQMTLIGSGISDYLEPIVAPPHVSASIELLKENLDANLEWDVCHWQDLSADTPLKSLGSEVIEETPCSEIRLTGSFEGYWAARSKSLRQNVRRDRMKAESLGPLQFEVQSIADPETMHSLFRLHAARWRKRGESGMIEANHSAAFLDEIAREFGTHDQLRLFLLRFQERIAAVMLGFLHRKTLYNYLTAFDPETEVFGLGRTLLFESIRYSYASGYHAWNFLRGKEPYKTWWGAECLTKCRVIVRRRA